MVVGTMRASMVASGVWALGCHGSRSGSRRGVEWEAERGGADPEDATATMSRDKAIREACEDRKRP